MTLPPVDDLDARLSAFAVADPPSGIDKVTSLAEAVRAHVGPGAAVHIAYSDARPNAAILELVRRFDGTTPGLTISTAGLVSVQHALLARGLVKRVIASFSGDNYPVPAPNPIFQKAVADGLELENWSMYALIARLIAGALGVDAFPVRSIAGSGMEAEHVGSRFARVDSPFGDGPMGLVRAYRPDVTILQGMAADRAGNVVLAAPYGEALWGSLAACHGVIACVERVVDADAIRGRNDLTIVPGHVARAVCPVPFGSHPYGLYNPGFAGTNSYGIDHDFLVDVQRLSRDPEQFDRWIDEWVIGAGSHDGYLAKLGDARLTELVDQADPTRWRSELSEAGPASAEPAAPVERMVVAAAHVIADRARTEGFQAVLAGVGFANLAAWLARRLLHDDDRTIALMAEIGMFGYDPRPGDPFIFSIRNQPTCTALADVVGVLGTYVSGPGTRSIGSLGAGEVDQHGNLNSTWSKDGRFIVGSGGANDIASGADEVIVTIKHGPQRLVEHVSYITCPGARVRTIVTSEGILERRDDRFELAAYFEQPDETARAAAERIVSATGWPLSVAADLRAIAPPVAADLDVVRRFDPRRTLLR